MQVYSVEEAAHILGLSSQHIRHLLVRGEIKGKKLGRDWVVLNLNYKIKRMQKGGRTEMPKREMTVLEAIKDILAFAGEPLSLIQIANQVLRNYGMRLSSREIESTLKKNQKLFFKIEGKWSFTMGI